MRITRAQGGLGRIQVWKRVAAAFGLCFWLQRLLQSISPPPAATLVFVACDHSAFSISSGPQKCAACIQEGIYEPDVSILESSSVSQSDEHRGGPLWRRLSSSSYCSKPLQYSKCFMHVAGEHCQQVGCEPEFPWPCCAMPAGNPHECCPHCPGKEGGGHRKADEFGFKMSW